MHSAKHNLSMNEVILSLFDIASSQDEPLCNHSKSNSHVLICIPILLLTMQSINSQKHKTLWPHHTFIFCSDCICCKGVSYIFSSFVTRYWKFHTTQYHGNNITISLNITTFSIQSILQCANAVLKWVTIILEFWLFY